jgi:hypothetical protein
MSDERFEYWQKRIKERFSFWLGVLGLDGWQWEVAFHREGGRDGNRGMTYGSIDASWEYRNMLVNWYVSVIDETNPTPRTFDAYIVHELLHAVVDEMGAEVPAKRMRAHNRHEERVVTTLAESFSVLVQNHADALAAKDAELKKLRRKLRKTKAVQS